MPRWLGCAGKCSATGSSHERARWNWARVPSRLSFYGIGGLGLRGGAVAASAVTVGNRWKFLPILFWMVFVVWQVVPIMLASFQEQFDLGILLRFPVRFGSFFLLYVVFGLRTFRRFLAGSAAWAFWWEPRWFARLFLWTALRWCIRGLQYLSGTGHLCLDRPLVGAAQDARDSGRGLYGAHSEPATAESGAAQAQK